MLLRRLEEINDLGQSTQQIAVLVRTVSEITMDQERQLKRLGVTIESKSGIILSVTLPATLLPDVAQLEFVVRIEQAKRLKPREDQ